MTPMLDPRKWVAEPDQIPGALTFEITLHPELARSKILYSDLPR